MAKNFSELRSGMSPDAQARAEAKAQAMMNVEGLTPPMLSALRQRGHSDEKIGLMSPREAFDEYCQWHGLVNWGDTLWEQASALMKLEKPAVTLADATPPVQLVVTLSGGVVQGALASESGISVTVIDYDKNAEYAMVGVHDVEVNPSRVAELVEAVEEAQPASEYEHGRMAP